MPTTRIRYSDFLASLPAATGPLDADDIVAVLEDGVAAGALVTDIGSTGGTGPLISGTAQALTGTDDTTAMSPAKVRASLPYLDVRTYGAIGDGSTNDTTAINAALTAAGALAGSGSVNDSVHVHLNGGDNYLAVGISVPTGVVLIGNGARITASATGTIVTLAGGRAEVRDVDFVGLGAASAVVGIEMATGTSRQSVRRCFFDQLGGIAIKCRSNVSWISDCFAQNCLGLDASLSVPTGVLDIDATDCWIVNCEVTASQSAMSASGNAYAAVFDGAAHTVSGLMAEISDHGVYVAATDTRIVASRSDLNRGHGFVFAAGSSGEMSSCLSLNNGRETTNTYDGFNFVNTSRWRIDTCTAAITTGNTHRYGFYDATSSASVFNQYGPSCLSIGAGTAPISVTSFAGARVTANDGPFLDITAGAATWNVQTRGWPSTRWNLKATGAVLFTNFTNGVTGMELFVRGDGFTTFDHNTSLIRCKSGADTLAAADTLYHFVNVGGVWFEV